MVNTEQGEIALHVGGRLYTLALKTPGLIRFQKYFSSSGQLAKLEDLWQAIMDGSVEHIAVLIWAALRKYHPEVTLEQAIELIDEAGGITGLHDQLLELGKSATGAPEDLEALGVNDRPRKAQIGRRRGIGTTSTATRAGSV